MNDQGYVNYFEILGVSEESKPGEVRNAYKKRVKDLLFEIDEAQRKQALTEALRDRFVLDLARVNAAFYILRDNEMRAQYVSDRQDVITLEEEWRLQAADTDMDALRKRFDGALRDFLSRYMEELVLQACRDPECVKESNWNLGIERHASRVLRHYRQRLYHEIHERLPFYDVTEPQIDWNERARTAASLLAQAR